jgi:hypothetical protein
MATHGSPSWETVAPDFSSTSHQSEWPEGQVIVLQSVEQFTLYTGIRPSANQINRATAIALNQ